MNADHESSYYEIALTNRQVLTIFVVLLTCLVAAFLSGVWIGRRRTVVSEHRFNPCSKFVRRGDAISLAGVLTPQVIAALVGLSLLSLLPVAYKKLRTARAAS